LLLECQIEAVKKGVEEVRHACPKVAVDRWKYYAKLRNSVHAEEAQVKTHRCLARVRCLGNYCAVALEISCASINKQTCKAAQGFIDREPLSRATVHEKARGVEILLKTLILAERG
jgi:hypothetical protein